MLRDVFMLTIGYTQTEHCIGRIPGAVSQQLIAGVSCFYDAPPPEFLPAHGGLLCLSSDCNLPPIAELSTIVRI